MKHLHTLLLSLLTLSLTANDGAFYASGNQLIPILETDVAVKKEVLKLVRVSSDEVKVIVEYEFWNPVDAKEILVGFEAPSPAGDVNGLPREGKHPYMRDFTVLMNGEFLEYETALVKGEDYAASGVIQAESIHDLVDENFDPNYPDFYYVNHFKARFKKGLNKIKHEYIFRQSQSIEVAFGIHYILTAANRWANKQIDDFTLILDLGDYAEYNINRSFFNGFAGWSNANRLLEGKPLPYAEDPTSAMRVLTKDQPVVFQQMNFKPQGELYIFLAPDHMHYNMEAFNSAEHKLPYDTRGFNFITSTANETSFKILRNYPFARRGYVFKTAAIQAYYEAIDWYVPDPNYSAKLDKITEQEREWLIELKKKN